MKVSRLQHFTRGIVQGYLHAHLVTRETPAHVLRYIFHLLFNEPVKVPTVDLARLARECIAEIHQRAAGDARAHEELQIGFEPSHLGEPIPGAFHTQGFDAVYGCQACRSRRL